MNSETVVLICLLIMTICQVKEKPARPENWFLFLIVETAWPILCILGANSVLTLFGPL